MATNGVTNGLKRSNSIAQSETSQTAQDYIASQLSLEADAREALPYQFDTCTKPLGPLRQSVYACLTCTPPPASPHQQFTPAGVCYSCSISCHTEHNLVELFAKRDFECDCGTRKFANSGTPCSLRTNAATAAKGGVTGETARAGNKYNQNFEGKFCGCGEEYDPEKEKGTMFQCIGLGHVEDGGCGEDWWHPECLMGLPRRKIEENQEVKTGSNGGLETVKEETEDGAEPATNGEGANGAEALTTNGAHHQHSQEEEVPPGFPAEEDFDHLICYKCANAFPWIKQYAGTAGFLPAVPADGSAPDVKPLTAVPTTTPAVSEDSKKRKAEDETEEFIVKKVKSDPESALTSTPAEYARRTLETPVLPSSKFKHETLPPMREGSVTLFAREDFREYLCRCPDCFPRLAKHPQLLEEEETYEPPVSESDQNEGVGARSVGSGSLYERGEAALSQVDRVRAIEGITAYNNVKDKVKAFLAPFAESGQAVSAEDVKAYFAKLRGDDQAMKEAAAGAEGAAVQGDGRKEQDGY
ncbi:hypothetical protein CLAFUW4_09514 [Fulvia fulva]|uniref:UBR-type domain-containing protein n=1 Tax=Passalora fulva TaxID=5499 RepID=A0A9Q8PFU7_PASFU|nr:uncharacterized protein CLAFUR5_09611 [Fulvia fulva]KAK4613251.1 hypothetical protein CLAFUR4_09520 [Fulvia fulva]KAK4614714.1 hypothetical protein CLAFUR0_09511 [Fulvia fulva]UJO21705.1 hypothetical protein CLAFUR5_09611 [Fulvia fulva]WPV20187.1 hypothetical protein CLAFUW4_09514 [Fulvia fulva]WPV34843.1 hypothetical protein CLAFUW7_09515 [Fulvia fulva]